MRVLIIDSLHPIVKEKLSRYFSVEMNLFPSPEELAAVISKFEILVMRVDPTIDGAILETAENLKIIGVGAAGLNHIDLEYARRKGIKVINVPGGNHESVAELTIGRIIDILRRVPQGNHDVKESGIWDKYRYMGNELKGKTLGLVALGKIGGRVAELASCFKMRVLAYDPFISHQEAKDRGVRLVSLEELLQSSNIVSLHAPLTKDTYHLINEQTLGRMRKGSYLLNMARGELVDEKALYEALKSGWLAGAGADVMYHEPCCESPLYNLENFIITPHIGSQTHEAQERIGKRLCDKILEETGLAKNATLGLSQ